SEVRSLEDRAGALENIFRLGKVEDQLAISPDQIGLLTKSRLGKEEWQRRVGNRGSLPSAKGLPKLPCLLAQRRRIKSCRCGNQHQGREQLGMFASHAHPDHPTYGMADPHRRAQLEPGQEFIKIIGHLVQLQRNTKPTAPVSMNVNTDNMKIVFEQWDESVE